MCVRLCEWCFHIFIFLTQEASFQKFHIVEIFIKHNATQEIIRQAIVLYFVCPASAPIAILG